MTEFLLDVSIRSTLFALCALVASMLTRGAAFRHAIWTAVLLGMLLMPILTMVLPPMHLALLPAQRAEVAAPAGPVEDLSVPSPNVAVVNERPALPWIALAWGLGALILAARTGVGLLAARRVLRNSKAAPGFMHVRISDAVAVPVTVGLIEPTVLLPASWESWSEWKRRAILAHEMAHVERRDTVIAALASLNCCVFWFHPIAWWLKNHLAKLAEQAADDISLLATGDRVRYAELLLEVASSVRCGRRLESVAMARSSKVGARIHRILDESEAIMSTVSKRGRIAVLCVSVTLLYAAGATQLVPQVDNSRPPAVVVQITPAALNQLEDALRANPNDVDTRFKLLMYYYSRGMREQRMEQLLWLIENHPESQVHERYPWSPQEPASDFAQIRAAWSKQVELHPASAVVLGNAGLSLIFQDPEIAEQYLKKAGELEPANKRWSGALAKLYAGLIQKPDKPEMAKRIQEELLVSNDAFVVGTVGRSLSRTKLGEQLLERARALDPQNPWWKPELDLRENAPQRIRVGAKVQEAKLLRTVMPEYPPLARQARIQGTVRFDVIVAKDGRVLNLTVINGHPLLVPNAMEAVRHYEYQPTLLNGQPVEVVTQVDVNFTLGGAPAPVGGGTLGGIVSSVPSAGGVIGGVVGTAPIAEFPLGDGPRIRVDGKVQAAKLIHAPMPEYPPLAQQARIQGTVRFSVLIDKNGKVVNSRLDSGHPLLVPAAQEAVRQYEYQPTLLNGNPIEVATQIDVNFRLP